MTPFKCVDYRELKKVIIKNKYTLPRIVNLLNHFQGATILLKIDLWFGYHHLMKMEQYVPMTTSRIRYRHCKFLVMSFRLINVHVAFLNLINNIFK